MKYLNIVYKPNFLIKNFLNSLVITLKLFIKKLPPHFIIIQGC